jgi:SAM-dependent methyltransferase
MTQTGLRRLWTFGRLGWATLRTKGRAYPELEGFGARDAAGFVAARARVSGARILDIGSGHGSYQAAFEERGGRVTLVDLVPRGGTRVVRGDAQRLPFRPGSFDGVVCSNVLEHLPSPARALAEIAAVLRPGGWAYVSWTNWYSPLGGHEFSPWHFLGVRAARAIGRWIRLRPPVNVPGQGLFPVHVGPTLRLVRRPGSPFLVRAAVPRYWPSQTWILHVPVLRELATWNCLLLLERREAVQFPPWTQER